MGPASSAIRLYKHNRMRMQGHGICCARMAWDANALPNGFGGGYFNVTCIFYSKIKYARTNGGVLISYHFLLIMLTEFHST